MPYIPKGKCYEDLGLSKPKAKTCDKLIVSFVTGLGVDDKVALRSTSVGDKAFQDYQAVAFLQSNSANL